MIASIEIHHKTVRIDLSAGIDISIPITNDNSNPAAWYVDPPIIEPVRNEEFIGSVHEGGSVNFRNISFNPHGHGTHTECLGHISEEIYSINQSLKQFFFLAQVISVEPEKQANGDEIITWKQIENKIRRDGSKAIIIRTLPNEESKLSRKYSATNPPYVEALVMKKLVEMHIDHFLIDLPSVDREVDGGELAAHHAFWEYPEKVNLERTITELIYVPSTIKDGNYILNLQIASFENDATPSKPVLYTFL